MAAGPDITEHLADTNALPELSVVALDACVPRLEPMPLVKNSGPWRWSLAAAVLLHAGVCAAFTYPSPDMTLGGGGTELDSISVDVVAASALDVIASARATAAASQTDQRLADRVGSENERAAAVSRPGQKPDQAPETPAKAEVADLVIPDLLIKPEPLMSDQPSIVIAAAKAEEPVEAPKKPDETKIRQQHVASTPSAAVDDAMAEQIGGVSQRGVSAVEIATQSAAVARAGEIAAYARQVQFAVAKNPPKPTPGARSRGEVVIAFALGPDGSLAYARIHSSSGKSRLDEAALRAVRGAQFPPPPAGSQTSQLTYKFPVRFL